MTISIEQSQVHGFEFLELINLIPYPAPKLNQENLVLVPPKLWFSYWTIEGEACWCQLPVVFAAAAVGAHSALSANSI